MIITTEMLILFDACKEERAIFATEFPDGLDVSGLWGDAATRAETWQQLLAFDLVKRNLGWAIKYGLLPARITGNFSDADLRYANLRYANLSDADLRYANLRYANLSDANLSCANLSYANLRGANLSRANLSRANLYGADLRYADLRCAIGYTA